MVKDQGWGRSSETSGVLDPEASKNYLIAPSSGLLHHLSLTPVNIKLPSHNFGKSEDISHQQSCDIWWPHQSRHVSGALRRETGPAGNFLSAKPHRSWPPPGISAPASRRGDQLLALRGELAQRQDNRLQKAAKNRTEALCASRGVSYPRPHADAFCFSLTELETG